MSTIGIGLVAFKMSPDDIKALSKSLIGIDLAYKVVVDNSPNSFSQEIFHKYGWTYISNPRNPGFGSSHNFIFDKYATTVDYHLIVNPDITFEQGVINKLIEFMDSNLEAGCVMPKVYYPDGRIQRLAKLLPSPMDWLARRLPFPHFRNQVNERIELHHVNYESGVFKAPFLSGCFLLFRVSSLVQTGFFDERFYMYTEDTDISRRLWENGTFPYYYGLTSITHGYAKGSANNMRLFKIHISSAVKYFNKWGWFDRRRVEINNECLNQFM